MTAVAVFDVLTDVNTETVKSNLIELWIYKSVDIRINPGTQFTTCILQYIFYQTEEEKSLRDIVAYLLNVSRDGWIYYYPSWECYEEDNEEDEQISVDDIFIEKYEPSLCGSGRRFLLRQEID